MSRTGVVLKINIPVLSFLSSQKVKKRVPVYNCERIEDLRRVGRNVYKIY